MANPSRRRFLAGSLTAAAGLTTFNGVNGMMDLAKASAASSSVGDRERYYIFCYFGGGWDILVGLDPRDPAKFTKGKIPETFIDPNYAMLPLGFRNQIELGEGQFAGPYFGDMVKHWDKTAIVRGLNMETLSHDLGRKRFLTGRAPAGLLARGSSASTWLASHLGVDNAIPNISLGVEAYNVDLPAYATALRVSSSQDLITSLSAINPTLPASANAARDVFLTHEASCEASRSKFIEKADAGRRGVSDMLSGELGSLFDFSQDSEEMAYIRDHYNINMGSMGASAKGALAVQAIVTGVSRCVTVNLQGGFDTHGTNWRFQQGPRQAIGWNAISKMVDHLGAVEHPTGDGSSWLDYTTIIAFSEFSRTPLINANGGRDHHLCNSALLVGGPVNGGNIVGSSSDIGLMPMTINPSTGLPDPAGVVLKPENVLQSLMVDAGMQSDEPDFRVAPIAPLMKSTMG